MSMRGKGIEWEFAIGPEGLSTGPPLVLLCADTARGQREPAPS